MGNTEQRGFVNFPTNKYRHTGENGLVVRLIVEDVEPIENDWKQWMLCSGGYNQWLYDECLLNEKLEQEHFPDLNKHLPNEEHPYSPYLEKYLSIGHLAVITIGTTTWVGFDTIHGEYWKASYEDLTAQGKVLWHLMENLYPGCQIHLLTFLDT